MLENVTTNVVTINYAQLLGTRWNFCPGCGQKLELAWKHCCGCGKQIGMEPPEITAPFFYPQRYPYIQPWMEPYDEKPYEITWTAGGGVS